MPGILITLEGIEGSGKSTQLCFLADRLFQLRLPFVSSKEPGGTCLGSELRSLLLSPHFSGEKWAPEAELLLFYADRAQHLESIVRPALASDQIVILDRFEDSTRAYQGAQGISESALDALGQIVLKGLKPDLTLLFDLGPGNALKRVGTRNKATAGFTETRFDNESVDFYEKVRTCFLRVAAKEPDRVRVIDANDSPEAIAKKVWTEAERTLAAKGFL